MKQKQAKIEFAALDSGYIYKGDFYGTHRFSHGPTGQQ
jgi:hypothetical protein